MEPLATAMEQKIIVLVSIKCSGLNGYFQNRKIDQKRIHLYLKSNVNMIQTMQEI